AAICHKSWPETRFLTPKTNPQAQKPGFSTRLLQFATNLGQKPGFSPPLSSPKQTREHLLLGSSPEDAPTA
ncbi:hypothetical protein, partial [Oscillatoria sp. HE19RPO]|uniref:hypothetical protein n=1 Tax=Oscillatoria sp. HE19RPO TaxID=2954806 RepID=UPI0020C380F8